MIKFFRKIRYDLMEKNKTGKYLKYAIGEIVLVIIGILLALQINEWNGQKKDIRILKKDLEYVLEDLMKDKIDLSVLRVQRETGVQGCSKFIDELMKGREMIGSSYWEVYNLDAAFYEMTFKRNQNGFEKVLSSELFQSYEFKNLREKIDEYTLEIERVIYDEERLNYFVEEKELEAFSNGTFSLLYEQSRANKGFSNLELADYNFDWQDMLKGKSALKAILLRYEDDVIRRLIPQYNKTSEVGTELQHAIKKYINEL